MKEYEAHRKSEDALRKCIDAIYKGKDTEAVVERVLATTAKYYSADRCFLYEYDTYTSEFRCTYEWLKEGIPSIVNALPSVDSEAFLKWVNDYSGDGEVSLDLATDETTDAFYEDESLLSFGINSILAIPIREGKSLVGFLGVDNPGKYFNDRFLLRSVSVILYTEITRRRQAKAQEKEAEKQKRQLELDKSIIDVLANEYSSVFYVDLDSDSITPIRIDPAMEIRFGELFKNHINYSPALRIYVNSVVHPDDQEEIFEAIKIENVKALLKDKPMAIRRFRCFINGKEEIFESKCVKMGKENAKVSMVVIGIANRERETREEQNRQFELIEANRKAEEANRAKSTFLFNMSHDIRTPMNAIIGYTDMMEQNFDDVTKRSEYLGKVRLASRQLLGLVNDVLDMARIENGKVTIEENPNDIVVCTNNSFQVLKAGSEGRKLSMLIEYRNIEHNRVFCDELRLNRIFTNIISNSIKYTKPGGQVHFIVEELSAERPGYARYKFTITDTGIGMSDEFVHHVFESFAREHSSTTSGIEGAGLGMAITKSLVDMMDGTIDIKSELGVGTIVSVRIDFRIAEVIKEAPTEVTKLSEKGLEFKRVLLVEDNEMNREIARNILESRGLIVEEANDGSVAVEMVLEKEPDYYDYVLMDIQMPYMDGYKATRAIRSFGNRNYTKVPIIAMTANAFEEDKKKALMAGMDAHLAKPINVKDLFRTLQRFV